MEWWGVQAARRGSNLVVRPMKMRVRARTSHTRNTCHGGIWHSEKIPLLFKQHNWRVLFTRQKQNWNKRSSYRLVIRSKVRWRAVTFCGFKLVCATANEPALTERTTVGLSGKNKRPFDHKYACLHVCVCPKQKIVTKNMTALAWAFCKASELNENSDRN